MVAATSTPSCPPETWSTPASTPDAMAAVKPYTAVWQRMNGSPIDVSLSATDQTSVHHVRLPTDEAAIMCISSPLPPSRPSTAASSQHLLDSAALFESLQDLRRPESPFRSRFRRLSGVSLSGSLFRVSRSDPNLGGRFAKAADSRETLRPAANVASPLCAASPLVCVFGDDGEEVLEQSKEEGDRGTVRGLGRTKAKGLSRSISNLFRRSALDGDKDKVKVSAASLSDVTARAPDSTPALEQPGTDSPSVAPSCFSWESNEEVANDQAPPRSATLTLKRLATFLRKAHAPVGQDVSPVGTGDDNHSALDHGVSTLPIPAAYTLENYTFDATPRCGLTLCEQGGFAPPSTQTLSKSGTRRRMNSLIGKMSIPRSPRKGKASPTNTTEPFSPTSSTASATPLSPSSEIAVTLDGSPEQADEQDGPGPLRVPREERSKWSDSSVGHDQCASEAKEGLPPATQVEIEELGPSRRSSGILGEEGSYTTAGFESSNISAGSSAPIESPVADRSSFCGRTREPSDASDYDDDSEEAPADAGPALLQAVDDEDTIIEILDSNSYLTSDHTHFEDCATDPSFEAGDEDQERAIHFAADSDEITPATHLFDSSGSSASVTSSSNHFYDISFASTAPSSRSHGSQQALGSAADYQCRALPSIPAPIATETGVKSPGMRHQTSLRDLRGQTIGLPAAERTNYLAPKCHCCSGTGREGLQSGRGTPSCFHLPLVLPTSPRRPGTASSSCTEAGLRRPPTPSGLVVAMPTSKAPLRKRRASFTIRRSALSCEAGGLLCTCPGNGSCKRTSMDGALGRSTSNFGPSGYAGRPTKPTSTARPMTAGATAYAMF